MYKIIGADQKAYGPVSFEQMRQWLAESRINGQTQVQAEGTQEWKPLSTFPEFATALGLDPAAPPPFAVPGMPGTVVEDVTGRDYTISIGDCVNRGRTLLSGNFGLLFVGFLVYLGIELLIGILGAIPLIGVLFTLANLFLAGPLLAGIYYLNLRAIRRHPAVVSDVFIGFRTGFLNLFLGKLIPSLFAGLCLIPTTIVTLVTLLPNIRNHNPPAPGQILIVTAVGLICFIPMTILSTNWIFTLPLIVDKGLAFWPAMQLSWKMVTKHWWQVFALLIVVGLINLGGLLLCCVGTLLTIPLTIAAMMYAYEEIFGPRTA